ncbi:hypothetical protein ANN_04891 [Periplaneta americana]|uniref:Multiple inositol polyphosphate phosphatase 1 n=1 Tax=Periplaneta americana TaxID=6978 RepID=A0ABQ8TBB3_PERAM|nr:hypothetical protein ANN_04891 [Periplaneta americana]
MTGQIFGKIPVGSPRKRWLYAVKGDSYRLLRCWNYNARAEDKEDWRTQGPLWVVVALTVMPCNAWIQEVDKNEDTLREKMAFDSSEHMRSLIQAVSTRLGFKHELSHSYVDSMYITCRFEKAWRVKELSPWCAVFSEEELKILEFRDDLKYYYFLGYANEINKKVGCPPAKDFLYRFSQLEMGDAQPAGVFYFSHDTVLQLFFTSIDIGKDEVPLTHSNFEEMRDRQWRTSILTPFAGNFAAVFFKCNGNESHKVQFYLREKLLDMDGCDEGLCDWSYIKQKYNSIIKKCNLDFCELKR